MESLAPVLLLCAWSFHGALAANPPAQPAISVAPSVVDFGIAGWSQRIERTVTVRNIGNADLRVGFPFVTPTGEFMVVSPTTDFAVAPGGEQSITLDFVPVRLGQGSSELVLVSNDPLQPRLTVVLTGTGRYPVLEISPLTVSFGSVVAGESKDLSFTVRNAGTAPLTVRGMRMSSPHFQGLSPTQGYMLAPGGSQPVTVRFAPKTSGDLEVELRTLSDAANNDQVIVKLTGVGLAPDIELDPTTLDFGQVDVGRFEEKIFRIHNVGNRPLTVQGIPSADENFRAVNPPRPFDLAPGASQVVTVRFTPCDTGALSGNLQIQSNDPDEPKLDLPLTGGAGESDETVISLNARDGEVVTWSDPNGRVVQRVRVWLDASLRIKPEAPKPVGDHFESSRATVTGTLHLWGEATDTGGYEAFTFDEYFDLNSQGTLFTSRFDPVRGQVFFLAGRLASVQPGKATPYKFEYDGPTERLRLWVRLPAPWDYGEADEYYDLQGLACLPGRPPLEIIKIDDLAPENVRAHHTSEYWRLQQRRAADQQLLVLRRAQPFALVVTLSRRLLPGQTLSFRWEDRTSGGGTCDIPSTATLDAETWSARIDPADVGKPQMRVLINIPRDAAIGEYHFQARLQVGASEPQPAEKEFPRDLVVVFNPWNAGDECWLASSDQRDEYVGGQWGALYNILTTKDFWFFHQFSPDCVDVCLWALGRLEASKRASPAEVASHLCAMSNKEADEGILVGLWGVEDNRSVFHALGGKHPSEWTDSGEVFKEFLANGKNPLRYAQCWVFAGVTTSLLRGVGIPARPVKGYNIGRDLNLTGQLEWVWEIGGQGPLRTILQDNASCSDLHWEWHVWCEAWMARPDLPGSLAAGGWQALDSSPQQTRTVCSRQQPTICCTTEGLFKQGPAPLQAVREHATKGIEYEVDRIYTSIAGPIRNYVGITGGALREAKEGEISAIQLAKEVITKRVGWPMAWPPESITSNYRSTHARPALAAPPNTDSSSGIAIDLTLPEAITAGTELTVSGRVQNRSVRGGTYRVVMNLVWVDYSGHDLAVHRLIADTMVSLEPDGSVTVSDALREADYLASLNISRHLEARLVAWQVDGTQVALARKQVVLLNPPTSIELPPAGSIDSDEPASCRVTWANPLSVSLENVTLEVVLDDDLAFTTPPATNRTVITFGTLPAGGALDWTANLVGRAAGQYAVHALIGSDQLGLVRSTEVLQVGPAIILTVGLRASNVELSFNTVAGERYRLEYKEDLAFEAWLQFGDELEGVGGRATFTDTSISSNRQRFYRVRVLGR